MEVGLSRFSKGKELTGADPFSGLGDSIHMLPVFRLPKLSTTLTGGLVRRLRCQETQQEKECRLRDKEELEKMKAALGLSDREVEALEDELLPGISKGAQNPAVTSKMLHSNSSDNLDFSKGTRELLYGPEAFEKQDHPSSGKRRRHHEDIQLGIKDKTRGRPRCWKEARAWDKNSGLTTHGCLALDLPTPRVLRHLPHSALEAEPPSLLGLSVRCSNAGKVAGSRTPIYGIKVGVKTGCILGTAIKTEQLIAAAADVSMVNLLELRRALEQSVGQVKRVGQV